MSNMPTVTHDSPGRLASSMERGAQSQINRGVAECLICVSLLRVGRIWATQFISGRDRTVGIRRGSSSAEVYWCASSGRES